MPMVIGVSATPKRFLDLMANAEHTVTTHSRWDRIHIRTDVTTHALAIHHATTPPASHADRRRGGVEAGKPNAAEDDPS